MSPISKKTGNFPASRCAAIIIGLLFGVLFNVYLFTKAFSETNLFLHFTIGMLAKFWIMIWLLLPFNQDLFNRTILSVLVPLYWVFIFVLLSSKSINRVIVGIFILFISIVLPIWFFSWFEFVQTIGITIFLTFQTPAKLEYDAIPCSAASSHAHAPPASETASHMIAGRSNLRRDHTFQFL